MGGTAPAYDAQRIVEALRRVVLGQDAATREVLVCLLARGHILIEGVPGTAKTLLVRTLALALDVRFVRIQFTPDLMPADITGITLLTGQREFWSLPLTVTPDVLIPRPDTETLVDAVLKRRPAREARLALLDLGTGSGAVALALASERPGAQLTASDVSSAALAVARKNAEALGLAERIRFVLGDGFAPVAGARFDVIVSNPPYVAEADAASLAPELRHEPGLALFQPGDGTALLRRIVSEARQHLEPGGLLALELAPAQASNVTQCLVSAGFGEVAQHRDLTGRVRAVSAVMNNPG